MMETAQSFTARRSAASNLPQFQLPPPDHMAGMHKYPAYAPSTTQQPTPAIVSSVLTPPSGLQTDLSPLGSASVNSQSSGSSAGGVAPYQPMGYWPTPGNNSYTYSQAPPMPPTFSQGQGQSYMGRQLYSPSMNFPNRNTNSPSGNDGLPPPPYDINLPSFPTMSSGQAQNLSHSSQQSQSQQHQSQQQHAQQQQQQQQAQSQQSPPQSQPQHQQQMNQNSQQSVSQAPPQGPLHAPNYGERPPPTPSNYHYTPSSTPQQSSFPAYAQQSPTQQSPQTSSAPSNRISPVTTQHPTMAAPQGYRPPFGGYNLPAMAGPIMSNVHSPGGQMALVGGMNMPYPGHQMGAPMYPTQHQQSDRPFKCDQCPQSFNRNHDLKRHKRIHLAVKPFPCQHCEKSFSRKDALKRHILVKGCGTKSGSSANVGSQSPVDKSEVMSDSTEGSPDMLKKEL